MLKYRADLLYPLHNLSLNWFGTNQTLSTWNRVAGGCSSAFASFRCIKYSLTTHVKLFCCVTVAFSGRFRGKKLIRFASDAILLEVSFIDERKTIDIRRLKRSAVRKLSILVVDPLIFGTNY